MFAALERVLQSTGVPITLITERAVLQSTAVPITLIAVEQHLVAAMDLAGEVAWPGAGVGCSAAATYGQGYRAGPLHRPVATLGRLAPPVGHEKRCSTQCSSATQLRVPHARKGSGTGTVRAQRTGTGRANGCPTKCTGAGRLGASVGLHTMLPRS